MSTDPTVTAVVAEIDPDPDAILAAHGADDPDALLASGGEHDPSTDETIDADDVTAAAVFADLQAAAREVTVTESDRERASDSGSDLELVGPAPTETRIPSAAFGIDDVEIANAPTAICWDGPETDGATR